MNIVSFETAIRLKEAGFPQPKPDIFGFWYGQEAELGVVIAYERMAIGGSICYFDAPEKCFYAPTLSEILLEIEKEFSPVLLLEHGKFMVCSLSIHGSLIGQTPSSHESASEAAALAWLLIHEKSKT